MIGSWLINEVGEVGENFGFAEGNNECAWVADKLGMTGVGEKLVMMVWIHVAEC